MAITNKSLFQTSDEAYKLVSGIVVELADEKLSDPRLNEPVAQKLWFVDFPVTVKNWIIKTKLWIQGAQPVWELENFRVNDEKYWKDMTYDLFRFYEWEWMSSEAKAWAEVASSATDIPEALRQDLASSVNKMSDRLYSITMAENEIMSKILTDWFDNVKSSYWPWMAVYDGKQLFSGSHLIIGTWGTQSNIVWDSADPTKHAPLTFTNLLKALEIHRNMRDWLGVRVRRSDVYDLVVPPALEKQASDVLSNENGFMPYTYSWAQATNNNFDNVFQRGWFKVRLVVLDTLGQPDIANTSANVWNDTNWFVLNPTYNALRKSLRKLSLWQISPQAFLDDNNRATWLTVEKFFWAVVLYYEGIVGSKWDLSTITG